MLDFSALILNFKENVTFELDYSRVISFILSVNSAENTEYLVLEYE